MTEVTLEDRMKRMEPMMKQLINMAAKIDRIESSVYERDCNLQALN